TLRALERQPFCRNLRLITRREALEAWKADTGEDLEALFGINPLSPEITFTMPADWSTPEAIARIEKALLDVPGVEEVALPGGDMVATMNSNIGKMSLILGVIAIVMLLISFVLINNTVHLTIYARRFIIHTMQLVGATNGFIRRPVVWRNFCAGLIAGLIASALLGLTLALAPEAGFTDMAQIITWPMFAVTAAGLVILGSCICALTASIATTRYLRKDYSELFH
ncbi:MAG: permease-like cell division protein FtsX, partial [Muribaculaceae bacterium]|nr:permease-like cell division protein FtsX [Muribaculaceae bacterium]